MLSTVPKPLPVNQKCDRAAVARVDEERVVREAELFLDVSPNPITRTSCGRSAGGAHDFYSEGDYWWPNPNDPDGPYVQRDGMVNPDRFESHREAMMEMSRGVAASTAAFLVTGDPRFSVHAVCHLEAWFVDSETRMNPHFMYSQAVKGVAQGRSVGIIDGIHLVEAAQAFRILEQENQIDRNISNLIVDWFRELLGWMTGSKMGREARDKKNNHGSCWTMQVAAYARVVGDKQAVQKLRKRYKRVLLPKMSRDGSFPLELQRTRPFSYSLFHLDILAATAWLLSDSDVDMCRVARWDGRSLSKGVEFMAPFISDKTKWPYGQDVAYWDEWPLRHPSLLFAAASLHRSDYFDLWRKLPAMPASEEGLRNFPVREPMLWLD